MRRFHGRAMNTEISTVGLSPADAAEVFQCLEEMEKQFSRFLPDSQLSRVNRKAGMETPVSEQFMALLYEALLYVEQTGGIFSPFLGFHMNRLGYRQTFESIGADNEQADDVQKQDHSSDEPVVVDLDSRMIKVTAESLLDFGGFAKGWSVQHIALNMMRKSSSAGLIDAGGDLMAWNRDDSNYPWQVGLAHPYSDRDSAGRLWLKGQAGIATSSVVKRSWKHRRHRLHHIIDPRTLLPAQSDCIQATVIGRELVPAEVYAKCLLILGSQEGPAWLSNRQPDLAYILLDREGRLTVSSNLSDYCQDVELSQHVALPDDEGGV